MTKARSLAAGVVPMRPSAADAASAGQGTFCAVAKTRSAARVTDARKWCERVSVSTRF
jgi:hypothetical protein